jgi:predicted RNA-binding Zn-ribbon protein involved in translation (DUF1610 family)
MSSVVLRCPNCGTTQAAPGECDACHEAQVRYFCTNHDPGQWLASPKCPQCGAQFGLADPMRRAASPPPRPPVQRERQRGLAPPAPAPRPVPVPAPAPAPAPKRKFNPWGPISRDSKRAERDVLAGRLRDMLATASRRRRGTDIVSYDEAPPMPAARTGCLGRALLLTVLLIGLLLFMTVFAGGPFLQILLSLLLSAHG